MSWSFVGMSSRTYTSASQQIEQYHHCRCGGAKSCQHISRNSTSNCRRHCIIWLKKPNFCLIWIIACDHLTDCSAAGVVVLLICATSRNNGLVDKRDGPIFEVEGSRWKRSRCVCRLSFFDRANSKSGTIRREVICVTLTLTVLPLCPWQMSFLICVFLGSSLGIPPFHWRLGIIFNARQFCFCHGNLGKL